MKRALGSLMLLTLFAPWAMSEETNPRAADEAAIRKSVETYVAAFNKHDAVALAALYSPEAVYIDRESGDEVVGRKAIGEQFEGLFKETPELKLEVATESIQFLSPNVAIEHGTAKQLAPKEEPEDVSYQALYIKRDGQWLLDRVTDEASAAKETHYKELQKLEWMIGRWIDQDDEISVVTECKWTKNRNYLTRSFTVTVAGKPELSGMQIVGWDANAKQIRSWTFDSDGGFAEGTWTFKKDRWYVQNKGVTAAGLKASMVNIIKQVDDDSFTWQTVDRSLGGEILPSINEVLIVRDKSQP